MHFEANEILAYGIIFGILMMSIFYSFIRYIYSKEIIYICYCFMQVFSLSYIATYSTIFDIPHYIQDFSLILATASAVLFAIAFYEGKFTPDITNYKEFIINTLLLYIVILTVFYHYILFEYLPYTVVFAILFSSVIFNLKRGKYPTIVYVVGWALLCFFLFVFDMKEYFIQNGYMDIVLMGFAVEAVLFTTSISYKYVLLKNEATDYQNMLLQQSKMAKSGEMIGNITHQFRQPLNNISYILINMKKKYENGKMDSEYFNKKFNSAEEQLQFLSKTIDDFKEFYVPSKQKEDFIVKEAIENSITILSSDLKQKDIDFELKFNTYEEMKVHGIKNELAQVVLALISNASEALHNVENPWIKIEVNASSAECIIKISDNAKGIKDKNIEKIFEPYFSTKDSGTGIGLYLVKMIIEKSFEGRIEVKNKIEGAEFTLYLEKAI
ncbi:MAG: signal transduction histidine kinase [Sulfurimonas sp.]|uniref:ATP-binding protein n=1 Tax=Sulfurimonas sp. TaxID=2022749 RepID=UPI0039E66AEB